MSVELPISTRVLLQVLKELQTTVRVYAGNAGVLSCYCEARACGVSSNMLLYPATAVHDVVQRVYEQEIAVAIDAARRAEPGPVTVPKSMEPSD